MKALIPWIATLVFQGLGINPVTVKQIFLEVFVDQNSTFNGRAIGSRREVLPDHALAEDFLGRMQKAKEEEI